MFKNLLVFVPLNTKQHPPNSNSTNANNTTHQLNLQAHLQRNGFAKHLFARARPHFRTASVHDGELPLQACFGFVPALPCKKNLQLFVWLLYKRRRNLTCSLRFLESAFTVIAPITNNGMFVFTAMIATLRCAGMLKSQILPSLRLTRVRSTTKLASKPWHKPTSLSHLSTNSDTHVL